MEALKLKIDGLNQTFKAITEMLNGGLITNVDSVTDATGKTGLIFTIQTYSEASGAQINTYTIWNGTDGKDGNDGNDGTDGKDGNDGAPGSTPQIGMEKEEATGLYYWTLNGEPMKDADGKLIYTSKAPKLQIDNDGSGNSVWKVSYDDGATWENLGVFTGNVVGSSITVELDATGKNVIIKQTGKTDITIPIVENKLKINFTNINASTGMKVMPNGVYLVNYTLENASANATVKAEALDGTKNMDIEHIPAEKKIKITVKDQAKSDVILVHVYDGGMCMHTSFNIAPDPAIKAITIGEPEVLWELEAGSDDVEYQGTLTLPEAATEELTFSVIPAGTYSSDVFTIEPTVTIASGSPTGTYKVTAKRSAMTAGTAYTIPSIIFYRENADYHVSGSVMMTAGIPVKINLTADMLSSKYTSSNVGDGDDISKLCDGDVNTYWGSNYQVSCPVGDATYGVYIDIALSQPLVGVKLRYATRSSNTATPKALVVGVSNMGDIWDILFTHDKNGLPTDGSAWWEGDKLHMLSSKLSFSKIRFGITKSSYGGGSDLITNSSKSTALSELEVYGLYGK